jgi:hypothetical protein
VLTMDEVWNDDIIIEGKMIFSFSSSSFSFFFLYFEGRSAVSFAKEVDLFTKSELYYHANEERSQCLVFNLFSLYDY